MRKAYKITNSLEMDNNHSLFLTTQALGNVQGYYKVAGLKWTKVNTFLSPHINWIWNSLPQDAKEDKSIIHSKMKLDNFIEDRSTDGYKT